MSRNKRSQEQIIEDALYQSDARYRAIVEDQPELICRWAPDRTLTFVNPAYCRYFGRPAESLIGLDQLMLFAEESRAPQTITLAELVARLRPEAPLSTGRQAVVDADGVTRWRDWTDRGIFDASGQLIEIQSVGRDVTERMLMEQALQFSEARLAEAQRIAHIGSWEQDFAKGALHCSAECYRIYGWPPDLEIDGERLVHSVHPDDAARVLAAQQNSVGIEANSEIEFRIVRQDGAIRHLSERRVTEFDETGRPVRMTGVVQDITERKLMEELLEQERRVAAHPN